MNHTAPVFAVSLFFSLFLSVLLTNTNAYALPNVQQVPSLQTSSTLAKLYPIIITSLSKGQLVSIGKDIALSGLITAYDAASQCHVSINVNGANPHRSTIDTVHNGPADYSNWNVLLTYTIKSLGMDNKTGAKNTCSSNGITQVVATPNQEQEQDVIKTNNSTESNKTNADRTLPIKSLMTDNNKAVKNNSTRSTSSTSRTLDLVYVGSSKLSGYIRNTKSTTQDAPFILPFP